MHAFDVLGSPIRRRILELLAEGECTSGHVVEIVGREFGVSQPAVSQQLRVLRHLGLVVGVRRGRHVVYELHDDHVADLLEQVVSHVEHVRLGLAGRDRRAEPTTA